MNELSKEIITIGEVDYTLFLNRKGIVAWEKFSKSEKEKYDALRDKYKDFVQSANEEVDFSTLDNDTNPFAGLEEIEDFDQDKAYLSSIYKRLYWIMFYTNHQLSINDAANLYDKACEEYGEEQVIALAVQMIEDLNKDPNPPKLKNLAALKPKKN